MFFLQIYLCLVGMVVLLNLRPLLYCKYMCTFIISHAVGGLQDFATGPAEIGRAAGIEPQILSM